MFLPPQIKRRQNIAVLMHLKTCFLPGANIPMQPAPVCRQVHPLLFLLPLLRSFTLSNLTMLRQYMLPGQDASIIYLQTVPISKGTMV